MATLDVVLIVDFDRPSEAGGSRPGESRKKLGGKFKVAESAAARSRE